VKPNDRYIDWKTVNKTIVTISRSTFHELVKQHAFGPDSPPYVIRLGGKGTVMVQESAVRRWLEAGGTSMHQLVKARG